MRMNYNRWFYETHAYLYNTNKDGIIDYNDTKYIGIGDRYKRLVDLRSDLFSEQPFGVISNKRGFDKLIDLLEKSNYTFGDINDSLTDSYKLSLTNAMSGMLVNTHAIMFKCSNTDKRFVSADKFSKYYIVDIPFNQLHFGDRDEFIRQQLQQMHTNGNDKYVSLIDFNKSPFTNIIGFTLMCCVNGKICNDALVAIDDKGFKFKIGWPYDYKECKFIVYKLDKSKVYTTRVKYEDLINNTGFIKFDCKDAGGERCIINLYDSRYAKTTPTVPNFGILDKDGIRILNLQKYTLEMFERLKTVEVDVVVYALKYLFEVPGLYPAVNYYDLVDTHKVYTENGDNVVGDGDVYASSTTDLNDLNVCTPPIVIDKNTTPSYVTIVKCLRLKDDMYEMRDDIRKIGITLSKGNITPDVLDDLKIKMTMIKNRITPCYETYIQGAILTSLVDSERIESFEKFMMNISNFITKTNPQNYTVYTDFNVFPELYDVGFTSFVDYVTTPFVGTALGPFADIIKTSSNYFVSDNTGYFNRPVSEQCFISMIYDRNDGCWVFDIPSIEHFKGIGNAFYINDDLKGDEIFKFFVLYTDTGNPGETVIPPMTIDQIFDFDTFYDEVSKHIGYVKYWNAENKLMKLCKIIYKDYTPDKTVHILSKILKRKLDGVDIIDEYPTEMNYEPSNITSSNWDKYNENTDNAPFAVNFLFYTISLMNGNEDKLQSYFYRQLIKRMQSNRYSDIDISSAIDRSMMFPINYSSVSISPVNVDKNNSMIPLTSGVYGFYGIPFLTNNSGNMVTSSPYRYTFNTYQNGTQYPLITENDCSLDEGYISYDNIESFNYTKMNYRHDIWIARMCTRYLIACYDAISYLQTFYKHPFNSIEEDVTFIENISDVVDQISEYREIHHNDFINPETNSIIDIIITNPMSENINDIDTLVNSIRMIAYNGRSLPIETVANYFLQTLESVYKNTGFDDGISKRVRNTYIHFKKINHLQSIYDYLEWVNGIDLELINNLDNMRSENDNDIHGSNVFAPYGIAFGNYINHDNVVSKITSLKNMVDTLYSSAYPTHLKPIIDFCKDIIENWIFDFFALDDITYDKSITYNQKPYMITVDISPNNHYHPKRGQIININATMIFEPIVEKVNDDWIITDISKVCEYAFFDGSDVNVSMRVLSQTGSVIQTISGKMTFVRIGSTADDMVDFNQLPNMKNLCVDIQNVHEEFEIDSMGHIVNKKFGKMNYELLIENMYHQLDHISELVLEKPSMLPGSIDRIYIPGQLMNNLSNRGYGQHDSFEVYFKPSQVLHIPISNDELTSVGGKYFVGQTLYLATVDEKMVFPIIVTATDMSESNGFVEAVIDQLRANWIKLDDINDIKEYLSSPIECTILDDNICNFLDEFTNSDFRNYQIPEYPQALSPEDEDNPNAYSLPGDPIYVTSNAPYIYTRLNWIFNEDVENRFMDSNPQDHHMIYIGSTDSLNTTQPIKIKLINHTFDPFTAPENYPILREEPDDHFVWEEEIKVFNATYLGLIYQSQDMESQIISAWRSWYSTPEEQRTDYNFRMFKITIEELESKKIRIGEKGQRIKSYINQLETPTTWYNVRTYETAKTYIENGRANLDFGRMTNIRNIPYTDKLTVYIYDWENHVWLDPSSYSIAVEVLSSVRIGEYENYNTNLVMNSITITPTHEFPTSRRLLIYFAYDQSDVFDSITINTKTCNVRFKPLLALDDTIDDYDPYGKISIRKQFDGKETYVFDDYSDIPNFSKSGYLFKRPNESGKQIKTPNLRFRDLVANNEGTELTYSDFTMYVKLPYPNITLSNEYRVPNYSANIIQNIDGFVSNQMIKLICISNNEYSSYNGNVSSVMFEANAIDNNGIQQLEIINSTLPQYATGTFTCTVFKDNMYPHSGGLITVSVTSTKTNVIDGDWVELNNPGYIDSYRIIPEEFVLVPKTSISGKISFIFKCEYNKSINETITVRDDLSGMNPYLFYYNDELDIKYPISDVRKNNHDERLVINTTTNPNVKVGKNTYLSICRYACEKIPKNGIIDMTGYLPTPLSRDHYEFWVNGRYIRNDDVIILSPTSIQLINLKSLRNFECVELVDDFSDSILSQKSPVYIDLNGQVYGSHKLVSDNVFMEDVRYSFNANNQQSLQLHTESIISNPNNKNVEKNILETFTSDNDTPTYYDELINVPSINGVDIYNPMSYNLGLIETPNENILGLLDKVWKFEQSTNPLFPTTHMIGLVLIDGEHIILNSKYSGKDNMYILYATGIGDGFFTFYISNSGNATIDDTENTLKIIPFIRTGVFVYVDKSYQGKWLHCTHPNVKPIKIM